MTHPPEPELAEAGNLVATLAADGETRLRAFCESYPDSAPTHFLLGAWLDRSHRPSEALPSLDRALALDPNHVQALVAKASVLHRLGRSLEARQLLVEAVAQQPGSAALWANAGVLHESAGDFEAALAAYDRAIALPGDSQLARMNRGYTLTRLGRLEDALANNKDLVRIQPQLAAAHFNVAEILLALGRYNDAKLACDQALAIDPGYARARIDRALALAAVGEVEEAQRDLDQAKRLDPAALAQFNLGFAARAGGILEEFGAYSIYFHLMFERLEQCDWSGREALVRSIREAIARMEGTSKTLKDPNLPFRTLGFGLPQQEQRVLATSVAAAMEARVPAALPPRPSTRHARIRVGYVSPDFRVHPAAYLTRKLYRGHDRSRFEVLGYGLVASDGSRIAGEVRSGFDVFHDVTQLDTEALAHRIREDGVDILVDLAGYTNFSRSEAFALRPAPLQVSWLGYPGTLGARYMDYALVDGVVCPPGCDMHWTEKLVRLPDSYFITDPDPWMQSGTPSRAEAGLPEGAFVFCCFNNAWKIEPRIFSVWMDILRRTPGSVLWLLAFREEVRFNLKREAGAHGVDPGRLVFGGRLANEAHLPRYRLADLFLDTLQYNAHTTAIEALREGTPVVTVTGESMPSRVATSLLHSAGLPELACETLDAYRDMAVAFATTPGTVAQLRSRLIATRGRTPLFDVSRFIRNLEAAYMHMWERELQGLPPSPFEVPEAPPPARHNRWF